MGVRLGALTCPAGCAGRSWTGPDPPRCAAGMRPSGYGRAHPGTHLAHGRRLCRLAGRSQGKGPRRASGCE
eukprot:scaffold7944_cov131-Isochrysis_galbana.AAC.5